MKALLRPRVLLPLGLSISLLGALLGILIAGIVAGLFRDQLESVFTERRRPRGGEGSAVRI